MTNLTKVTITSEEIINFLKTEIAFKEVHQKILFRKIISRTAQEKGIIVTDEEIDNEVNRLRREKRLEKATDTIAWLTDQLVNLHDWEEGIRNRLLAKKLAEALFAEEAKRFFVQNRLEFEQVILYQLIVSSEKLAQELYYQLEEGEISFPDAAYLYDLDDNRKYKCGYEGKVYRLTIPPDIATVIFSTPPKQLIGPIKTEQGYHLFKVEEFIPPELTSQRYEEIINSMFQQWLVAEVDYMLHSS
ncbi:peptidylprolyl isomerase [Aetokthonos hydrillicola Thurmond2011]|jgi:parvulin-like peptidyl-prolyl isomerase|uniref:peptidylprolyl isomerase n=1 Tax=Aetokthonos hydrillicola Thurmond2011 TaxID=2712845 RepID=A0AAP5I2D6_9CYAN|nr:peptidylprolyl isomerase [Aetokthonos hydrillicola]MBW4588126.1 peptidylprolyl isomerase [Aetokthonos hydrillicola CCALA 1050]MDR9893440.1 peptidylprolyl isomerase [Aetokthonos hydrillicola Thurmond2011]